MVAESWHLLYQLVFFWEIFSNKIIKPGHDSDQQLHPEKSTIIYALHTSPNNEMHTCTLYTNIAHGKIHHFDGIYRETWWFSWTMLVSGRVEI